MLGNCRGELKRSEKPVGKGQRLKTRPPGKGNTSLGEVCGFDLNALYITYIGEGQVTPTGEPFGSPRRLTIAVITHLATDWLEGSGARDSKPARGQTAARSFAALRFLPPFLFSLRPLLFNDWLPRQPGPAIGSESLCRR